MKKKRNSPIFLIILLGLFIYFLVLIFKPYNYVKSYNINNFNIIEIYNKTNKYYKFVLKTDETQYSYVFYNKYYNKRKLITNVIFKKLDNEECIMPKSEYLAFYPLCSKDNKVYTYNLSNIENFYYYEEIKNLKDKYKTIKINYLNNKNYLLYNYKGFYLLNNKKEIKLFDKDIYSIELVYQYNNNIIIPDYNKTYYFDKLYIIDLLTGKVSKISLDNEISFNSVFLGDYKGYVYLLDKKEEKEYKINVRRKKVVETDYFILKDNKLVKTNYRNIVNNSIVFNKFNLYKYEIIDNYLYQVINNDNIKISNKEVNKIIKIDNNTVYYLVKDDLYMYNNIYGEVLLLNNFEWNFNNTNMIFISE